MIKINAVNMQGNASASHVLIAEHPVLKEWKLTSNSPQLIPGSVKFVVSYPREKILPTNATAILSYGDGQKSTWLISESEWTGEQIFQHEYTKSGKYNVFLNISNVITSIPRRMQVSLSYELS